MLPGKVKFWCFEKFWVQNFILPQKDKIRVICDKIIIIFSYRSGLQAKFIGEIIFGENV